MTHPILNLIQKVKADPADTFTSLKLVNQIKSNKRTNLLQPLNISESTDDGEFLTATINLLESFGIRMPDDVQAALKVVLRIG